MSYRSDLLFILRNTVPVPGERAAVRESWINTLVAAGLTPQEIDSEIETTEHIWRGHFLGRRIREEGPRCTCPVTRDAGGFHMDGCPLGGS